MNITERLRGQQGNVGNRGTLPELHFSFDESELAPEPGAYFRNKPQRNGRGRNGVVADFFLLEQLPNDRATRELIEVHPNVSTFLSRENRYGGRISIGRAWRAFDAYIQHRDYFDLQTLRDRSRVACMKGDAISCDARTVMRGFQPQGGERLVNCGSFGEAAGRVVELVGPVAFDKRNYSEGRLGEEYSHLRERDMQRPAMGFSAVDIAITRGRELRRQIEWRVDWDEVKGCHFNVLFRPCGKNGNGNGYYTNCDPRTLNVAFGFPGDERFCRESAEMIEIQRLLDEETQDVSPVSYLSFTKSFAA